MIQTAQPEILHNPMGRPTKVLPKVLRRLSRPYKISQGMQKTVHGGINYTLQKTEIMSMQPQIGTARYLLLVVPINVLVVGAGIGQGIELPREIAMMLKIQILKRNLMSLCMLEKNLSGTGGSFNPINDSASYNFAGQRRTQAAFSILYLGT